MTASTDSFAPSAVAERQAAYVKGGVPPLSRGIVERSLARACSPRQAIKAKCLDCSGFDREEARLCRVTVCPLWPWRPYQAAAQEVEA